MGQSRAIKLEADILGANNRVAQQNRAHFEANPPNLSFSKRQ
jgi:hydrogenase nickel incorporation protein HypB